MERSEEAPPSEAGFALLAALIVLVALTALAVGGFWLSTAERKISRSHAGSVDALLAADAGLSRFLATHRGAPPAEDSVDVPGGWARISVTRLGHVSGHDTLYRVVATGRVAAPGAGPSTRTVETLAVLRPRLLSVPAAMVALNGVDKSGTSGTVSGFDGSGDGAGACPAADGRDGYGLAVPPGGYSQTGGGAPGGGGPPGGSEVLEGDPAGLLEDPALAGALGLDWAWLASGTGVSGTAGWPVVHVAGDHAVGAGDGGRGTLIVTGDLDMSGGFAWDGLVLVGGYADSNGDVEVRGALVTGLNATLAGGSFVAETEVRGGPDVRLHTGCVAAASRAFAPLVERPGSWREGG